MADQLERAEHVADDKTKVDKRTFEMTIFANERARSGADVILAGMQFTNYRKNPVVLWSHNNGMVASDDIPVGRTLSLMRKSRTRAEPTVPSEKVLRARFQFLPNDQFADRVRNAFEEDFLRASSIGWRSLLSEQVKDKDGKPEMVDVGPWSFPRIRHVKSELLEWSFVPIPADPDAVKAIARMYFERSFAGIDIPAAYRVIADVNDDGDFDDSETDDEWIATVIEDDPPAPAPARVEPVRKPGPGDEPEYPDPEPVSDPTPTLDPRLVAALKSTSETIRNVGGN